MNDIWDKNNRPAGVSGKQAPGPRPDEAAPVDGRRADDQGPEVIDRLPYWDEGPEPEGAPGPDLNARDTDDPGPAVMDRLPYWEEEPGSAEDTGLLPGIGTVILSSGPDRTGTAPVPVVPETAPLPPAYRWTSPEGDLQNGPEAPAGAPAAGSGTPGPAVPSTAPKGKKGLPGTIKRIRGVMKTAAGRFASRRTKALGKSAGPARKRNKVWKPKFVGKLVKGRGLVGKGRLPAPPVPPAPPSPRKRTPAQRKRRLLAGLGILVVGTALIAVGYGIIHDYLFRKSQEKEAAEASAEALPVIAPPASTEKRVIVPTGSSLASLLKYEGFSARDVHELREATKNVYDLSRIRAGHVMRITRNPGEPWQVIEYDIDELRYMRITNGSGGVSAVIKSYPFEIKTAVISGRVEDSLIGAVNRAGENDSLAIELAERCFGWEIDFYSDLRQGDTFTIYFEKKYISGQFAGYRNILAAEFINDGKVHRAYRFTYPDTGDSDFFDEAGGSKRREFLRSPFKFTARITSRFTSRRFHPVRKVYRAHYGVDYAAAIGTPVQATSDGRVISAGWNGGAGRMVKLEHRNHYETAYLHLSGFGPGIRKGARVQAGDVIGYVGSSGESTGPHLDYRIYLRGTPVNPLNQKFMPAEPLRREYLGQFKEGARKMSFLLALPGLASRPFPVRLHF